ncbi:hypothetical protein K1X76_07665 [bacterium]|nr:hypothetical protein [bacterium]
MKQNQNMHLLLPTSSLQVLKKQAKITKKSVAQLIREAIHKVYGGSDTTEREKAFTRLMNVSGLPAEDWETTKESLLKRYE